MKTRRFRLKSLIIGIALIAFLLTPVARRLAQIRLQRTAVSQLRNLGAFVSFEHQWDPKQRSIAALGPAYGWRQFMHQNFSEKAEFVGLVSFQGNTSELTPLQRLLFTTDLAFFDTEATDDLIEIVKTMPRLQRLTLSDSELDDRRLLKLANIPSLKYVNAMGTDVTAEGILEFRRQRPEVRLSVSYDEEFIKQYQRLKALSAVPPRPPTADDEFDN